MNEWEQCISEWADRCREKDATITQQAQEIERVKDENMVIKKAYSTLEEQLAAMTAEREAACGELLVSLDDAPIGSLAGKLVTANRVLRSQLAASQARCRELEEQIQSWQLGKRVTDAATQIREDQIAQLQARVKELEALTHTQAEEAAKAAKTYTQRVTHLQATLAAREAALLDATSTALALNLQGCNLEKERDAAVQEAARARSAP